MSISASGFIGWWVVPQSIDFVSSCMQVWILIESESCAFCVSRYVFKSMISKLVCEIWCFQSWEYNAICVCG